MISHIVGALGFECAGGRPDSASSALANAISRDAAYFLSTTPPRALGGFGLAIRQRVGPIRCDFSPIYSGTHLLGDIYYVRLAFRLRALPSAEEGIIALGSNVQPSCGLISIDQLGDMRLYSYPAGTFASRVDVGALIGSSPIRITANVWTVVDVYIDWAEPSGATTPAIALATDGAHVIGTYDVINGGYGPIAGLATSGLGHQSAYLVSVDLMPSGFTPATKGEYDFDNLLVYQVEYTAAEGIPYPVGGTGYSEYFPPAQMQLPYGLFPLAPSSIISPGSWTLADGVTAPDVRVLVDKGPSGIATGCIKSGVANDPITVRFSLQSASSAQNPSQPSGILVSFYVVATGGATTLTVESVGDGIIAPTSVSLVASAWSRLYIRTDATLGTIDLKLTHPNNSFVVQLQNLVVQVVSQPPARYALNPSVASVATGHYTGNSTVQSIDCGFSRPPSWIWIARDDAAAKGVHWHDGLLRPTDWSLGALDSGEIIPTQVGFDVCGASAICNLSGVTYRWFAVWDESERLLFRGAASTKDATQTTIGTVQTEFNCPPATFATTALWAHDEAVPGVGTNGAYYRGPGHTGANSSPLSGTQVTTGIRSLPGATWEVGTALAQDQPQFGFTAWSTVFGGGRKLWAIATYTGDGTGNRDITLDLGGYRPGWAIGVPHNAVSWFRSSTHPANTSQNLNSGVTSLTAIRAFSTDTISVGSTLNANGVVYDVLALVDPSDTGATPPPAVGDGLVSNTAPATTPPGCIVTVTPSADSGGTAGCLTTVGPGSDSGGGSGCGVTL